MSEGEAKDREMIRLKEQLASLEDKQMLIEKKSIETLDELQGKTIEFERMNVTLEEELKESKSVIEKMKKQRSEMEKK